MKKIILIVVLLVVNVGFAQTSLYKVTKKGNEMYIGGTVHLLRPTDFPLPTQFDKALEKSDMLVLEMNGEKLMNPSMRGKIMSAMAYKNGETLSTVLSPKTYQQLKEKTDACGFPLEKMNAFKPNMVILALESIEMEKQGISSEGVDVYLTKKAKKLNKSQEFLETVDFQLEMLATMGEGYEDEYVKHALKTNQRDREKMPAMIDEWKNGEKKMMLETLKEFKNESSKVYKKMLLDRNNNWMPKLRTYLEDDKTEFVAVGAAHLYGEKGILNQLKLDGCVVEQVK